MFRSLLEANRIRVLADVRHFPSSVRVPWTSRERLAVALDAEGIGYDHFVDLGGFRKPRPDSNNMGLRSRGLRGYADHMASPAFRTAIGRLLEGARTNRVALMCAEAVPWRCHRWILSDALVARAVRVVHILGPGQLREHRLSPLAKIHGPLLTYPAKGPKRLKTGRA